jgi:hypothetical protein
MISCEPNPIGINKYTLFLGLNNDIDDLAQ